MGVIDGVDEKRVVAFNLIIKIKCCKTSFTKTFLHSVEDEIESYGLAIHRAKNI